MKATPLVLSLLLVLGANQSCSDDVAPVSDQRVADGSTLDLQARDAAADQVARDQSAHDAAAPDAPLADLPWKDGSSQDLKADTKPIKCGKDTDCGKPACAALSSNDCTQTQPVCDLTTGLCSKKTTVLKNAFCQSAAGLCTAVPSQCKVDSDCGVPTCAAPGGSDCIQTSPKCINGQCSKSSVIVKNAVCDASGLCKATGPGMCKVDLDCGKPTCVNATSNTCTQTKPTCTNNVCKTLVTSMQNAVCDATTGLCK